MNKPSNETQKIIDSSEDAYWESVKNRLLNMRNINENGCWIFTGAKRGKGYGGYRAGYPVKKIMMVHRISAKIYLGFDAKDQKACICHKCDTPACFNPDHLFIGNMSSNLIDALNKGRLDRKLTGPDVIKIRELLKIGKSKTSIAKSFSVSRASILNISKNKAWAHIE